MSLFSALSSSLSGLQAATTQMQLVANNIANAGQTGYSRKTATLAPVSLGNGVGGGVEITGYARASDAALSTTLNNAVSDESLRDSQSNYLERVQTILGTTNGDNPPLAEAMSDFASAWRELAAAPESTVQKQEVVNTASTLVQQLKTTSSDVEALDREIKTEISTDLSDLHSYLVNIADLNKKISQLTTGGQFAGDLEDQRDQIIQKVAGLVSVNVMDRANGQVAVYTPSGYMLVDGEAASFSYDGTDVHSALDSTTSLNSVLSGGKIEALVNFSATSTPPSTDPAYNVIQKLRDQLDTIAKSLTDTTTPGTFGYAYAHATGTATEATSIFTVGADDQRMTLAVNTALMDGTKTIKTTSGSVVAATFNDASRTFTGDGLSVVNSSYETLVTSIVGNFQQAANSIAALKTSAASQKDFLAQKLSNATGVNTDTELVALTTLQNSYAASARVMSVLQTMFSALENIMAS